MKKHLFTRQPVRFCVMAAGFAGAALYHLAALEIPAFARSAYAPTYPVWRHLVFIGINVTTAYFMLLRPRWFFWACLVFSVQVMQGHGVRLWRTWFDLQRIQWVDFVTVCFVLLGLVLLYLDRRERSVRTG